MKDQEGCGKRPSREQIADRAGYWDARLRSPDCADEDRIRFAAWRDSNPEHRAAFERLQTYVSALRQASGRAEVRGLREAAASAVQRRRPARGWAVAASIALLLGLAVFWKHLPETMRDTPLRALASLQGADFYSTGFGQRSTVTLEDGSSVELNARTTIEVRIDEAGRHIRLLEGQALFDVAKDARRPFVVRAADRDIVAVGTAFDVRLDSRSVRVTLLEGKVNVGRGGHEKPRPQVLVPGQQFVALLRGQKSRADAPAAADRGGSAPQQDMVRPVDVAKVTGWRDGQVFLEDLTLVDAVAEMNRYSRIRIVIGDDSLAKIRVNGMFRAGEQAAFVAALQEYFPVTAHRNGDSGITLLPR